MKSTNSSIDAHARTERVEALEPAGLGVVGLGAAVVALGAVVAPGTVLPVPGAVVLAPGAVVPAEAVVPAGALVGGDAVGMAVGTTHEPAPVAIAYDWPVEVNTKLLSPAATPTSVAKREKIF